VLIFTFSRVFFLSFVLPIKQKNKTEQKNTTGDKNEHASKNRGHHIKKNLKIERGPPVSVGEGGRHVRREWGWAHAFFYLFISKLSFHRVNRDSTTARLA
jgi:hypothetical protein